MSLRYRNQDGTEIVVGGLTPGGVIEAGAVSQRSGSFNIPATAASSTSFVDVTFTDEMPDSEYQVSLDSPATSSGSIKSFEFTIYNKTASGFSVAASRTVDVATTSAIPMNYTAWKTYTVQHAAQNAESIAALEAMVPAGAGSGNKLVTTSQLNTTVNPIASDVANLKDLVPVGASITNQLVTKSEASVDSALSSTSEHAVQNKVVKAALDTKQDTLTFDNTPTAGSNNPVKSSGIYNTATDIYKVMGKNGAKNLLPNTTVSRTISGITYTRNSNGTVTINGTSTGWGQNDIGKCLLPKGTYTISVGVTVPSGVFFTLRNDDADSSILNLGNGGTETKRNFTLASDTNIRLYCGISGSVTVSNITFYPMVYLSSDTDSTYQPYAETNYQLTQDKMSYADNGILGAKNLLPNNRTTATVLGITYTSQSDGSFIVTGATTTSPSYSDVMSSFTLPAGTYILSSPNTGIASDIELVLDDITSGTPVRVSTLFNSTAVTFTLNSDTKLHCYMWINKNVTLPVGGIHFYPMIRLATDTDGTYQPYAMTNQQLNSTKALPLSISGIVENPNNILAQQWGKTISININGIKFTSLDSGGTTFIQNVPPSTNNTDVCYGFLMNNTSNKHALIQLINSSSTNTGTLKVYGAETNVVYYGNITYISRNV